MVQGSDKTYGQLILEAQTKTDSQEVGETLEPLLKQLKKILEEVVQLQAETCSKKGFHLPKYYIHIFIVKDPMAAYGCESPNVLRIRKPHCRVSRPSPYQDEDHYLWSVTNMNNIKFEWCIPKAETVNHVLANPSQYDPRYVSDLRKYVAGTMDNINDYIIDGKVV